MSNIFTRIGNWFTQHGNTLGKGMQIAGTTAMGVGMTGMVIHEMKQPNSIFGYGCMNPMMGSCCFGNSLFNMGGTYNMGGCTSMMGQQYAYNMGMQARMQDMANQQLAQQQFNQLQLAQSQQTTAKKPSE